MGRELNAQNKAKAGIEVEDIPLTNPADSSIMDTGGEKMKKDVHMLIQREYPLTINKSHQDKHIIGTTTFDPKRSTLTADPVHLANLYAGKSDPILTRSGDWSKKERFIHTERIGIWRDSRTGKEALTEKGIIHYSEKNGVHIVPSDPNYESR